MKTTDLHRHLREMGQEVARLVEAHHATRPQRRQRGPRAFRETVDRMARITILNEKIEQHIAELDRRDKQRRRG